MSKNITVLIGSPRKNGNTEMLADAFIAGAESAGHNITKISLHGKKISPCLNCDMCKRAGRCVFDDDMTEIYKKLTETDVIVFATPIYFYNFSSQLKSVIDRMYNPVRNTFKIKNCVLLSVCEDSGEETFAPLSATYKAIAEFLHWENLGEVFIHSVGAKGAVKGNPGLEKARMLGADIK
jgi:Multimeric flavodoxin WrbA